MYLFFDTETTGFPKAGGRICQLGALLTTDQGRTMAQLDVLIKPAGWVISQQLTDIHGISHRDAETYGVPIIEALEMFESFCARASIAVAHNFKFDDEMVRLEHAKLEVKDSHFYRKATCCTMVNATEICKIPSARGGYKWPKLQEIYKHLFNREFDNAHNAMADVVACKEVFFEMKRREEQT